MVSNAKQDGSSDKKSYSYCTYEVNSQATNHRYCNSQFPGPRTGTKCKRSSISIIDHRPCSAPKRGCSCPSRARCLYRRPMTLPMTSMACLTSSLTDSYHQASGLSAGKRKLAGHVSESCCMKPYEGLRRVNVCSGRVRLVTRHMTEGGAARHKVSSPQLNEDGQLVEKKTQRWPLQFRVLRASCCRARFCARRQHVLGPRDMVGPQE